MRATPPSPLIPSFHLRSTNDSSLSLARLREIARANRTRHWPPRSLKTGPWIVDPARRDVARATMDQKTVDFRGCFSRGLGWDRRVIFLVSFYFARVSAASNVNLLARLDLGFRCFSIARDSN